MRHSRGYNAAMSRVPGILLRSAIVLSLLLTIASSFFWIRSYWTCDWLTYCRTRQGPYQYPIHRSAMLRSTDGHIVIAVGPYSWEAINPAALSIPEGFNWSRRQTYHGWEEWNNHIVWHRFGFQYINSRKNWPIGPVAVRGVQFPYWSATIAFALAPLLALSSYLRHRNRRTSNACPTCGYDMRATPQRCPECGTPSSLPAAAAGQ